jgi:hypothetical protein
MIDRGRSSYGRDNHEAVLRLFASGYVMANWRSRACLTMNSAQKPHQASVWQIGDYESLLFSESSCNRFRGQVAAADGAFHGGGPAGGSPVAGEEDAGPGSLLAWAVLVDAGSWGEGRIDLFNHGGLCQLRIAGSREEFAEFIQGEVDDFLAGFVDQGLGGTDDQLEVAGIF